MKSRLLLSFVLLSGALVRAASAPASIVLHSGETFTNARIAAITNEHATIVHAGGVVSVSVEQLDLEVLARAKMQLDAQAKERAEKNAAAVRRVQERSAQAAQEHAERKALAAAFEAAEKRIPPSKARADVVPASIAEATEPSELPSIAALKQSFPPAEISRVDKIQYQAPSEDVWRWYRGMLQTTSREALPRTLQLVERRMAEDMQRCQALVSGASASGQVQAQDSLNWFETQLKPHIAEWRKLVR